jgi:hypothetical protein
MRQPAEVTRRNLGSAFEPQQAGARRVTESEGGALMSLIEQAEEVANLAGDVQAAIAAKEQDETLKRIRKLDEAIKPVLPAHTLGGHDEGGAVVQPIHDVGDNLDSLKNAITSGDYDANAVSEFDGYIKELGDAISYAKRQEEDKPKP